MIPILLCLEVLHFTLLFGYLYNNSNWSFLASLYSSKIPFFSSVQRIKTPSHFVFLHSCLIWVSPYSISCSFTFYFPYVHSCLFLVPKIMHQMIAASIQAFNCNILSFLPPFGVFPPEIFSMVGGFPSL